jgi:hypothetical protein
MLLKVLSAVVVAVVVLVAGLSLARRVGELQKPLSTYNQVRASTTPPQSGARVTLQKKVVRVIPNTEPKQMADQWVFHVSEKQDDTVICVNDEAHCITLERLRDQLYRPGDDPNGIR